MAVGKRAIPSFSWLAQSREFQLNPGDREVRDLLVPSGSSFHAWVGLANHITGEEGLLRSASRRTGTIRLYIEKEDHRLSHKLNF